MKMRKALLVDMLRAHGFSCLDADALVSGLKDEMVAASKRKSRRSIVGLFGGVIATGLAIYRLTAMLTIFIGAIEHQHAAIENRLDGIDDKLDALGSKIDGLADPVGAHEKPPR